MRGKKAKAMRRFFFGDQSLSRRARRYVGNEQGGVVNLGPRRAYQREKRER